MGHAQHSSVAGQSQGSDKLFCDDPIIAIQGSHVQRRRLAMGVLFWWCSLGLKLAYEKGSFGPDAMWIGTHFLVMPAMPVINKVEICLPAKKNTEILSALEEIMDNFRGMIKHADVRKVAGKESWVAGFLPQLKPFVRQLWASLYKDRSDNKVELVQEAGQACFGMVEKVPPAAPAGFGEASLPGRPFVGRFGSGGRRQHDWRRCSLLD